MISKFRVLVLVTICATNLVNATSLPHPQAQISKEPKFDLNIKLPVDKLWFGAPASGAVGAVLGGLVGAYIPKKNSKGHVINDPIYHVPASYSAKEVAVYGALSCAGLYTLVWYINNYILEESTSAKTKQQETEAVDLITIDNR